MNRNTRQLEWPWKDILYFAAALVVITLSFVVAATLFIENSGLQTRVEDLEDFADTIPGLLEDIRTELCDKIDALRDDLTDRIENIEESFQPLREKGVADGYAPLNSEAIVPANHLPPNSFNGMFLGNDGGGCWDPMVNNPLLKSNQMCDVGEYYISNNTGTTILDSFGGVDDAWQVGDAVVCTGDIGWKRVRDIPRVKTWNGITGDVEAFLGTLINVDEVGATFGDALVLHADNVWRPTECCLIGPGGPEGPALGFLAKFIGRAILIHLPPGDSQLGLDFRGQNVPTAAWTNVDFDVAGRFPNPVGFLNDGGANWDKSNPNFVHTTASPIGPNLGGSGSYRIAQTGWWQMHARIRIEPGTNTHFNGIRLFRSNVGKETVYTMDSIDHEKENTGAGGVRENNMLSLDGLFAFCKGETLHIQYYEFGDDDTHDPFGADLQEDQTAPFDQGSPAVGRFIPSGGMFWSMWKIPDALMPRITQCINFPLKKRDHNNVYQTSWADPVLTHRLKMQQWEQNTAFYNNQCRTPINCSHYKPGPKPEMPSFLEPPDSEKK